MLLEECNPQTWCVRGLEEIQKKKKKTEDSWKDEKLEHKNVEDYAKQIRPMLIHEKLIHFKRSSRRK
jgi:hypothetical protein